MSPKKSIESVVFLKEDGLRGSYVYSDAYMDDDRLTIETLRSAHEFGAVITNFVEAQKAEFKDDRVVALECYDKKSKKSFSLRAKHFISTVGPWTDLFGERLFFDWKKLMRPSKGIHLTLDRSRFPLTDAVVMSARVDKRIVFAIPRHEMVVVGTTDTDFSTDPSHVKTTKEDVEYLLKILNHYFPKAQITEKDILASYAGVRPLVADNSSTESGTSREHMIMSDPRNVTFVAGGKYTTYRHMAEQTIDRAITNLPKDIVSRIHKPKTENPLNIMASKDAISKAKSLIDKWAKESQWSVKDLGFFVSRHGRETEKMINNQSRPDRELGVWGVEANQAIQNTMCLNLVDFYIRRTPLMLARKDHGLSFAEPLSRLFAKKLSWSESQRVGQLEAIGEHIRTEMGWKSI